MPTKKQIHKMFYIGTKHEPKPQVLMDVVSYIITGEQEHFPDEFSNELRQDIYFMNEKERLQIAIELLKIKLDKEK